MSQFVYDFTGLDVHGVIIIREQIRKKLNELVPSSKAAPEFQELDAALGEYFYQEERKLVDHHNGNTAIQRPIQTVSIGNSISRKS